MREKHREPSSGQRSGGERWDLGVISVVFLVFLFLQEGAEEDAGVGEVAPGGDEERGGGSAEELLPPAR